MERLLACRRCLLPAVAAALLAAGCSRRDDGVPLAEGGGKPGPSLKYPAELLDSGRPLTPVAMYFASGEVKPAPGGSGNFYHPSYTYELRRLPTLADEPAPASSASSSASSLPGHSRFSAPPHAEQPPAEQPCVEREAAFAADVIIPARLPPVTSAVTVIDPLENLDAACEDVAQRAAAANSTAATAERDAQAIHEAQAMQAVDLRTRPLIEHAYSLAARGAHYSARAEMIEALRMITQALDIRSQSRSHSEALAAGLRALEEADDFVPRGAALEANLDLPMLAAGHRTPVLKEVDTSSLTPVAALQQYYTFAQQQLTTAGGGQPTASLALYGLGRLQTAMSPERSAGLSQHAPQAMVYYQAAMMVDPGNYKAANELGVLLARYGHYREAKEVLAHSVAVSPQPESWRNLATVHQRLGEQQLAARAQYEAQLAARRQPATAADSPVLWVPPEVLAQASPAPAADLIPADRTPSAGSSATGEQATRGRPASHSGDGHGLMRFIPWAR